MKTTEKKDNMSLVKSAQNDAFLDKDGLADALDNFENVDDKDLESTSGDEYLSLEPNERYNFVFTGTSEITIQGEKATVCHLIDKDKKRFITGSKVLVNRLSKVTQLPCFVRIITKDYQKGENGKYLNMDVLVIPQSLEK